MVEEGPEVDPDPALLQHLMDDLDKFDDVVSAVYEEAGDHTVLAADVFWSGIYVEEVSSRHAELGVMGQSAGISVRETDLPQLIGALHVVAELVDVRLHLEPIHHWALVEDEVAGKQHVETELIALALEPSSGHLPGQPAQPRPRDEDLDGLPVAVLPRRVVRLELLQQRRVALRPLLGPGTGPVTG